MGTWQELKERRLVQIVVTYLAAGWLCLEGLGLLIDREVFPGLTFQLALVAYITGIPLTLILGWFHGEKGHQKPSLLELGLLTVVAVGGLTAGVTVMEDYRAEARPAAAGDLDAELSARRVAVTYFDDRSEAGDLAHLADGLTESLIDRLDRVRELNVISERGVEPFRGSDLPPDSIARELSAGTVITGAVEGSGDDVAVTFRLVDGVSGTEFRRERRTWPTDSLLHARERLAEEVALVLREWLGEEIQLRSARRETESVAAWALAHRADRAFRNGLDALAGEDAHQGLAALARADSLYAEAVAEDPRWTDPLVERGWIAYERSWLTHSAEEAASFLDTGTGYANRALELDRRRAEALELRGTLRYRQWQIHRTPEGVSREQFLQEAREDLENAVDLDPGLARAHSTLSSLYYQVGDKSQAVLAARRAYEEDAYLRFADQVLWRLFLASYDLEQSNQAKRWCQEGGRRFPEHFRFVECQLWLMTMDASEPDVERAWDLLDRYRELVPETRHEYWVAGARMIVGGILGRAGLADSARSVLVRSRVGSDIDPDQELANWEAVMRIMIGDRDTAIDLLEQYAAANPGHFGKERALHWWYRDVQGMPEFRELREVQTGTGSH